MRILVSKRLGTGLVFALLISGMSGPRLWSLGAGPNVSNVAIAAEQASEVRKMQQALHDRGHYRGKVDGVIGLRTRASLRGFQKAENLPATGQLDQKTANRLGVKPESTTAKPNGEGHDTVKDLGQPGHEATKTKPSAGTKRTKSGS